MKISSDDWADVGENQPCQTDLVGLRLSKIEEAKRLAEKKFFVVGDVEVHDLVMKIRNGEKV